MYQPSLASNTVPLYATASGKAWLATLAPAAVARLIRKNGGFADADRYGPNVVRSMEALSRKLHTTRRRGYAVAVSEAESGVTAVAAAIRSGHDGPVVATVGVAGPGLRMPDQRVRDLAPAGIAAARELSALWPLRRHAARRLGLGSAARHRAA